MVQKTLYPVLDPSTQGSESDMRGWMFFVSYLFIFFHMSEDKYFIACLKSAVIKDRQDASWIK